MRPNTGTSLEAPSPTSAAALAAVREDIRQTLRMAWIDPSLEVASAHPVFFAAVWSAVRPNVGRSFLLLSRALRSLAAESLRSNLEIPDLRKRLEPPLSDEELRRASQAARAAHMTSAKVQIVVHTLARASRRERVPGTGQEEQAARRGVPEWQRWMSIQPTAERSQPLLERAARRLGVPDAPASLRLFARWPAALSALWTQLSPAIADDIWTPTVARLRRTVFAGASSLPHPVDLQWAVLRERGLSDQDRLELTDKMAEHERAAAVETLLSAFVWLSLGAPETGVES